MDDEFLKNHLQVQLHLTYTDRAGRLVKAVFYRHFDNFALHNYNNQVAYLLVEMMAIDPAIAPEPHLLPWPPNVKFDSISHSLYKQV